MRDTTNIRYKRIQNFYKKLKNHKLSHGFAVDIIKEFFQIDYENTVSKIIQTDIEDDTVYEHQDLDDAWIDGRLKKHFSFLQPAQEQEV